MTDSLLPMTWTFGEGQWSRNDWHMVQSPRWNWANAWVQETDHIRNFGPESFPGETYTSMIYRQPLNESFVVRATMSFDELMAPLLVVGNEPAPLPGDQREYRTHVELVLFNEGLNLWHHTYEGSAPNWTLPATWRFTVEPHKKYQLSLNCASDGLSVQLDEENLGRHDFALEWPLFAGITGCEGLNRFYDFTLEPI